ncbi:Sensor histidine kinase [Acidisarcina polymorpha]|uniref:Sensor histidine kinase n=1 Tax=Acidisarcina polymorpha TaxID=2211140 RepID=A0A2Z5FYV2_9BACT|nr:PAS domain S-box protein [Acidisarcina polymorpha]AXC11595.1 Sensor histidine kinase [Acidisarcina polymorpha]
MKALGQYTISWEPPQLREGERLIRLSPKQFKVLELLVEARGKVVSKPLFFTKVWKGSFVEDSNLTQTIFLIRRALGKLPDGSEFIETLPGRGYRLTAGALRTTLHPNARLTYAPPVTSDSSPANHALLAKRLQEAEQFRLLVESIESYAIYMLDCSGRVLTWNIGAEHNKGYKSSEVLGQHYSLFFVPEDIESRVPDRELSAAALRGSCKGEGWRIRKNGERYWASFVITAVRSPSGKLVGFAKVVRDLSERKRQEDVLLRMEAVLRRERDCWRAVAESSPDALFICEAIRDCNGDIEDFVITFLNMKAEKIAGLPRQALLGGKMCELLPGTCTMGLFEAYKQVVLTGNPYRADVPSYGEGVTNSWVRVHAVRVQDGIAITTYEISEHRLPETTIPLFNDQPGREIESTPIRMKL